MFGKPAFSAASGSPFFPERFFAGCEAWRAARRVANEESTGLGSPIGGRSLDGQPLLMPVPRVAEILGISRSAAYRCAASGDLPITHLGGRVYVITQRLQELPESA